MRIVAGRFRGRAIASPGTSADSSENLRPTSDRVRESIFNIIAHGRNPIDLAGRRVIDLFAGTGALGLEALSRGAAYCLFVDTGAEARGLIRDNVENFGLTGETRIFRRDATDLGPIGTMAPFDIAFLDPPYDLGLGDQALGALAKGRWLTPGATVVIEERDTVEIALPSCFELTDMRRWGGTQALFARFRS